MTEGNFPRTRSRAGSIAYASTLAALNESIAQLGALIRAQAVEHDRLTAKSFDAVSAVNAWRFTTEVVNDALSRLETAHAAVNAMTPDVLRAVRHLEIVGNGMETADP